MFFNYGFNNEIVFSYPMAITDNYDFSLHPTEILKEIRKNNSILMSFKSLKNLLSL